MVSLRYVYIYIRYYISMVIYNHIIIYVDIPIHNHNIIWLYIITIHILDIPILSYFRWRHILVEVQLPGKFLHETMGFPVNTFTKKWIFHC